MGGGRGAQGLADPENARAQDLDDVIAQVESKSRSREEARLAQAATSDTGKSLTEIMGAGGEKSFKIKVGTDSRHELLPRVAPTLLSVWCTACRLRRTRH